jgi:hypothetical protein
LEPAEGAATAQTSPRQSSDDVRLAFG